MVVTRHMGSTVREVGSTREVSSASYPLVFFAALYLWKDDVQCVRQNDDATKCSTCAVQWFRQAYMYVH
jgi:hypothetical protein